MLHKRVTIVGLGLMGGSLALALRGQVARLVGVDRDEEAVRQALAAGAIDAGTVSLPEGLARAELVVLATPVRTILQQLARLPAWRPDGCLVLDLGSTKRAICRAMEELPASFAAIGGHPLCGREQAGFAAADGQLFQDRVFVLCANARTDEGVVQVAQELIGLIGARPLAMPAGQHDEIISLTSALPTLLASLLAQQAAQAAASEPRLWQLCASGFRDASRLAGSDPTMMADILLTNLPATVQRLEACQVQLGALIDRLRAGDAGTIREWLAAGQAGYQAYRAGTGGVAPSA